MDSRARFAVVAVVLGIVGAVAFATTRDDRRPDARPAATAAPTLSGNCLQRARPIKAPSWYPTDLPMPSGSYAIDEPAAERGLRRVVFASKGDLRAFVVHALDVWRKQGWSLGKGEAEPGEAEDNFLKGDRYGVFRARSIFCEQDWTWVLIVLTSRTAPTPSFNTQTSASPSPLSS